MSFGNVYTFKNYVYNGHRYLQLNSFIKVSLLLNCEI